MSNATPAAKPATVDRGKVNAFVILMVVIAASAVALAIDTRFIYLLVYAWFGVIYGLFLQYGRFCMASAVRDLFAVGVPRMAVGVLIAVVLYSITSAIVTTTGFNSFNPHPLGWHIVIGGLLFGFGMVFSGGCASSSLYKTGEGNLGSILVLFSISFSQAFFVSADGWVNKFVPEAWTASALEKGMPDELTVTDGWFDQFTAGYLWDLKGGTLAQYFGFENPFLANFFANAFLGGILPGTLILLLLYYKSYRTGYLRRNKIKEPTLRNDFSGLVSMFTSSKNTAIAGLGLGIFAGLQMFITGELREYYEVFNFGELLAQMGTGLPAGNIFVSGLSMQDTVFDPGYWYITTQEAQWAGWILDSLGFDVRDNIFFGLENGVPNPLLNAPGMMSIGIILGAAMLANINREFKWKLPNLETAILAIVGGALMGLGSRIGMGCNIGAFFATVTNGDISGWIFLFGMTVGGYVGVKLFKYWIDYRMSKQDLAL